MSGNITTLQEVYNLTDFSTNNLWYMQFIKMPQTGIPMSAAELHVRCQQFQLPETSVQYFDVRLHNHVVHQPGITVQPSEITLPFVETLDMKTTSFMVRWREICSRSNDNYVSIPAQRRATIAFYHYSPQHEIIYDYRLEYVELSEVGNIDYGNGDSVNAIIRQCKFKVGAVYETPDM